MRSCTEVRDVVRSSPALEANPQVAHTPPCFSESPAQRLLDASYRVCSNIFSPCLQLKMLLTAEKACSMPQKSCCVCSPRLSFVPRAVVAPTSSKNRSMVSTKSVPESLRHASQQSLLLTFYKVCCILPTESADIFHEVRSHTEQSHLHTASSPRAVECNMWFGAHHASSLSLYFTHYSPFFHPSEFSLRHAPDSLSRLFSWLILTRNRALHPTTLICPL